MTVRIDLTNQIFGKWTVLAPVGYRPGTTSWKCRCACGTERLVSSANLRNGLTVSCGCARVRTTTVARGTYKHPLYHVWINMIRRCRDPNTTGFHRYGGRGIKVCERWQTFENFLADVGNRPSTNHTLDRIDNDGDYTPENTHWADHPQQMRNKTQKAKYLTAFGETRTVTEWSKKFGVARAHIHLRIYRGWPVEQAVLLPKGSKRGSFDASAPSPPF